jgi:hypothetical protein
MDRAKAGIPSSKAFARLLRRMELPARVRLSANVRAGKVGDDADEAALLPAMAQREPAVGSMDDGANGPPRWHEPVQRLRDGVRSALDKPCRGCRCAGLHPCCLRSDPSIDSNAVLEPGTCRGIDLSRIDSLKERSSRTAP